MKRRVVYLLLFLLALLHQDFWYWDDATLVFGFLPVGLAYHALYSLLAALLWWMALNYAWPHEVEETTIVSSAMPSSSRVSRI